MVSGVHVDYNLTGQTLSHVKQRRWRSPRSTGARVILRFWEVLYGKRCMPKPMTLLLIALFLL
jgi:hypothetical protein